LLLLQQLRMPAVQRQTQSWQQGQLRQQHLRPRCWKPLLSWHQQPLLLQVVQS
jgi:hypothetical protein